MVCSYTIKKPIKSQRVKPNLISLQVEVVLLLTLIYQTLVNAWNMECPLLDGLFCFQALAMFTVFDKAITNTAILRQYPTFIYWNINSVESRDIKKSKGGERKRD